jgi:hypothetical protein
VADELDADDLSSSTIWSMSSTHHVATVAGVFPAASDRRRTGSDVPARRALDVPSRWCLTLKMGHSVDRREADLQRREGDLDRREDAVRTREAFLGRRMTAAEEILAAADERDAAGDARDTAADNRENDSDRAKLVAPPETYGYGDD